MRQLSIYSKRKHYSKRDMTISLGQDKTVCVTLRNNSWSRITSNDYIRVWASESGELVLSDDATGRGHRYKLCMSKKCPEARYFRISGRVAPAVYKAAEKALGDNESISRDVPDDSAKVEPLPTAEPEPLNFEAFDMNDKAFARSVALFEVYTPEERRNVFKALCASMELAELADNLRAVIMEGGT